MKPLRGQVILIGLVLCAWMSSPSGVDVRHHVPAVSIVEGVLPFYPRLARDAKIQGDVRVQVSTDGRQVANVRVLTSVPNLSQTVEAAVKSWRFTPHAATTFESMFHFRFDDSCDGSNTSTITSDVPREFTITTGITLCGDPDLVGPITVEGRIAGTVYRRTSGREPVIGAHVVATRSRPQGQWRAVTNSTGGFEFPTLSPGDYRVDIGAAKYLPTFREVRLIAGPVRRGSDVLGIALDVPTPMVLEAAVPVYPQDAASSGLQGEISLQVHRAGQVTVVRGPALLASAAAANVSTWQFNEELPEGGLKVTFDYSMRSDCGATSNLAVKATFPHRVEISTCRAKDSELF
jgi:TonB family protein